MAFDARRGRLVVFGGRSTSNDLDDTWEWDGVTWLRATPTSRPSARADARMVYDSARGRVVLFGGALIQNNAVTYYDDLWGWNGVNWTRLTSGGLPARSDHAMAFDPVRNRLVMRGGWNANSSLLTDTWKFDGTRWQQVLGTPQPALLRGAAAWFDVATRRTLLFGHFTVPRTPVVRQELWALDGTGWSYVGPSGPLAEFVTLAHDPIRARTVQFAQGQTLEFDGSTWTSVLAAQSPGATYTKANAVTYDSKRAVTVLVRGGSPVETWEYDGITWTQLSPTIRPPQMTDPGLAYDPIRREVVLLGARYSGGLGSTWTWNGSSWTAKAPATAPFGRIHARLVWHPGRGTVVLFGGGDPAFTNTAMTDLWEWNGTTWIQLANSAPLGARSEHQMVYDTDREVMVVYGGRRLSNWLTDTWEWGPSGWTQRTTAANPGRTIVHGMAFDAARGRTLLIGGETILTWIYGPDHPASATTFGGGCVGSAGIPRLTADNRPWIGADFREMVTNVVPNSAGFLTIGVSNSTWGSARLPFDLAIIGMPGCSLLTIYDIAVPLLADASGTASVTFKTPNSAALLSAQLYKQALAGDTRANQLGATVSNGLSVRIGGR